jgi:5-carboxymethyl-2-hydroxymuconic-semialdehyde dehydrogenase
VSNTPYAQAARGSAADIDRAASRRRAAFPGVGRAVQPGPSRHVLYRIADAVEARHDRLAAFETYDTGLPITQARGQARRAAENFRYFADVIVALGEEAFRQGEEQFSYVVRARRSGWPG